MKIIYIKSSLKKPALFLDRDGVINKDTPKKYITSISDIKIYPSAINGLKKINFKKYHIFIITNQSAVGRGYMDIKTSIDINHRIVNILSDNGIKINAVYYCPHHPDDNCNCRKPNTGLIDEARSDYIIEMNKSFLVGDKKTDIDMALKLNLKSIFVLTGQGRFEIRKYGKINSDYILKNILNISKIVC